MSPEHPLDGLPSTLPTAVLDPHAVLAERQDTTYRAVVQLARFAYVRFNSLEARMASLSESVATLTAAITDLTSDLSINLTTQARTLAAMQATIDRLGADDAADKATIARLTDQLAAVTSENASAAEKLDMLTAAVAAADAPIDQPGSGPA